MYTVLNETIIFDHGYWTKEAEKKAKTNNETKQKQTETEHGKRNRAFLFIWRNQDKFPIDHFTHADHMVSDFAKFDQEQYYYCTCD